MNTLRKIFVIPLFLGTSFCQSPPSETQNNKKEEPPNIIFIISDDDDYENIGFMGNKTAHTPTLDMLASQGTLFTTAHTATPLCRPTLAAMLSGKLPQQNGIYGNYIDFQGHGNDTLRLDPKNSLPNRLKEAGYATYASGKYWEGDPHEMGFTHADVEVSAESFAKFVRQGQKGVFDFIDDQHDKKPMFVWWAPLMPHTPHNPPDRHYKHFEKLEIAVPDYVEQEYRAEYPEAMRKFYAMGTWFDEGVAELINKLKEVGEYENTIFVYWVDNGFDIGHLAKNSPFEKGLLTPMFVSWPGKPGRIPMARRINSLHYAIDLHATMIDYAGLKPTPGIESQSLRPLIEGRSVEPARNTLYGGVFAHHNWRYQGSKPRTAERDLIALYARTKQWKFVLYTQEIGNQQHERYWGMDRLLVRMMTRPKGDMDLYNLKDDPYEQNDLADDPENREMLLEFKEQVLDWWEKTSGRPLKM